MVYKKRLLCVLPIVILSFIIAAYSIYLLSYVQPKIDFEAQITRVSSDDYQRILDNEHLLLSPDKGIEKFRHIIVDITHVWRHILPIPYIPRLSGHKF